MDTPRQNPDAASPPVPGPEVASILECMQEPAILIGRDYRILLANSAYRALYGDVTGTRHRRCYEVSHRYDVPCDQAGESCPLQLSLSSGGNARVLHVHHTPGGEQYVSVEMWPVKDPRDGQIQWFIEILRPSSVASAGASSDALVGRSPAFRAALEKVERVAPSEATVMLLGESGTGKEMLAQTVHRLSQRRVGPFVPLECNGLPEALFESELFGYAKGAFTGARADKPGLVEAAAGGTLFLDEVGDIPLSEQVKLLRLLETRRYRRVGSTEWRDTDFRLICATHRDLAAQVRAGEFREDLYYRLNVFEIVLPPLRERREDIAPLVESLLSRLPGGAACRFDAQALACLEAYAFPGNIRELRNIVERALVLADDGDIRPEHLPDAVRAAARENTGKDTKRAAHLPPPQRLIPLAQLEADYLRAAVQQHAGDRRSLAAALGISERALYRKLQVLKAHE